MPRISPVASQISSQFENKYFTEMCSGSEAGSCLRLIDYVYHSTLGLRVIKKKIISQASAAPGPPLFACFRVSGFGFRVSGSGFRVSGFGFRVSGFGFQLSGLGFRRAQVPRMKGD